MVKHDRMEAKSSQRLYQPIEYMRDKERCDASLHKLSEVPSRAKASPKSECDRFWIALFVGSQEAFRYELVRFRIDTLVVRHAILIR